MKELFQYISEEFPYGMRSPCARDLVSNVLDESEKITCIAERCEWLAKMIPEITLEEIRNILLR